MDFTYVEDAANAIILASLSKKTQNKTYNITRGASSSLKELVEVLKKSFKENNQENMQTKIRRKSNGMFLVKYRKDPAFAKETKNGSGNKKNKGNTKKGKADT